MDELCHRWWWVLASVVMVSAVAAIAVPIQPAQSRTPFLKEEAGFAVKLKNQVSRYRIIGVYVLPGELLRLEVADEDGANEYAIQSSSGKVTKLGPRKWDWRAPQDTGLHPIKINRASPPDSITLNAFVMVPYDQLQGEYLNGYRIGKYPSIALKRPPIYSPPKGFVEVTPDNEETLLSPHFKLKQFLCNQEGSYPRYIVLKEALVFKLELILSRVNDSGYRCDTLHIMSGYRTPYYNKVIGNVKYSRHLWGGAADIFIDESPKDGIMDDLNHDGRIDYRDAAVLYDIIDQMYGKPFYERFAGGLARYKKTSNHGPFVHVDVRGFRARWGD